MHSFHMNGVTIHYNGDYSGDVLITSTQNQYDAASIPFDVLKHFMALYIMKEKISKLEQADDNELLGLN